MYIHTCIYMYIHVYTCIYMYIQCTVYGIIMHGHFYCRHLFVVFILRCLHLRGDYLQGNDC